MKFVLSCLSAVILDMLLRVYGRFPDSSMGEEALQVTLFTLKAMSNGGIHDHISQVSPPSILTSVCIPF